MYLFNIFSQFQDITVWLCGGDDLRGSFAIIDPLRRAQTQVVWGHIVDAAIEVKQVQQVADGSTHSVKTKYCSHIQTGTHTYTHTHKLAGKNPFY